jgi:hypothetical protein
MTDAWESITVQRFDEVIAGGTTSLLRLSAKAARRRTATHRPGLVVGNGSDPRRFPALPAPQDPRGTLRAAYSVPSHLVGSETRFWIERRDGSLTELPQPTRDPTRRGDSGAAAVASRTRLVSTAAESEQARRLAEGRLAQAEETNERMAAALQELEMWRAELERCLAATTTELATVKAERDTAQRELQRLQDAVAAAPSSDAGAPA